MKDSRYAAAGVDIDAKAGALARARTAIRSTFTPGVLGDIGGFGGLFRPDFSSYREPVLVASTDGVGTKLKVAVAAGRHDICGVDTVNHCVNDILVQGAKPLFFLDYVAMGRLDGEVLQRIIEGLARGCRENGTALLGGETAEMPGVYAADEYDVAGTIVGVVDRGLLLDGSAIRPSDVLIGLPSSGLHTNGYSLARKILFEQMGLTVKDRLKELDSRAVGDVLLEPHRSYLRVVAPLLERRLLHGMAHITGGGFPDNIARVLPEGVGAQVTYGAWPVPAIFDLLAARGGVERAEMLRVFNMGIGMVLFVDAAEVAAASRALAEAGERFYVIGRAVQGPSNVEIRSS